LRALEASLSARLGLAFSQRIFSTKSAQLNARGTEKRVKGCNNVTSAITVLERDEKQFMPINVGTVADPETDTRLTVVHPRFQKS
jgi:hypothetical protein